MARGVWHGLHIALTLLLFISLWAGFYFAGVWASTERRAELNKELRRRKKALYDWLASAKATLKFKTASTGIL
jgi:hypothetical protein